MLPLAPDHWIVFAVTQAAVREKGQFHPLHMSNKTAHKWGDNRCQPAGKPAAPFLVAELGKGQAKRGKSTTTVGGKVHVWAFANQLPFSRLVMSASVEHHLQLATFSCAGLKRTTLSTTRGKSSISTAYCGMAKLSQHHWSPVKSHWSNWPLHSCFVKSQPSLASPCPRRWRQLLTRAGFAGATTSLTFY